MLRSKQQEAAVLLREKSAERKAIEALSDVKKTTDKMVQKAKVLHKDAEMLLSDAKSDADWDLIDEKVEGLKIEIKELEDKVKMSEKTLTAAEKLAHAVNMAHRSNVIYAAVKPSVSKSKSGLKLEPFSEESPSRRPLPPQPGIFASMPTYAAAASKPAVKPPASKEKSKKKAESFSELPPSQRKTFGGKSKRRRLSSKKQTKRNRRN
jgi:chaperonin cofactor prefoldin